ncbi:hypothetical protein M422DRAFT_265995 [Sphaerobolus stellatus SS14]|uniref:Uncharacterized protein n=1 Tax=Sphaerobolus stellatus (strain SS14) TaxID=990650 RepID=A0A0C9TQ08_SPHS4|nr:hypothetical protein M422DRAFT_265995 [Sphaerobolus stellatus SS14]
MDELIKSGQMLPRGPAKELTITQNGPITLDLSHPARRTDQCLQPVIAYIEAVTQVTNASHQQMNHIQGEFKILWDNLQRLLSHLPLAHAYSDIDMVEELIKASMECFLGMHYLIESECHARW